MKKRASAFQRTLAGLLALVMCLGNVPFNVLAAEEPTTQAESQEPVLPYLDESLSAEERALDLVSRMTPAEKYAQLNARTAPAIPRLNVNEYDWWSEALHGVARDGKATSFPTGLGIAATWDVDMVEKIMSATSDEARDKFNNHVNSHGLSYWSPTINMARDPRWGRAEETYGEDPYLTGMIAKAFINGLQGDVDATGTYKTIATAKHFLANNSEQNRHNGSSNVDERDLREYYTQAFKYTVEEAGVGSIMTSYNAVNGVPMAVNEPIVDDMLRRTWGFDGYVVTDCWALQDILQAKHGWYPEGMSAAEWSANAGALTAAYSIQAGIDLNCGNVLAPYTGAAVSGGLLSEDEVDRALVRLFTARIETGEFDADGGYYGGDQFDGQIQATDHQQLAEDSADNAVVLLKNENNTLPLKVTDTSKIVLIGDRANEVILGDYSTNEPENTSTAEQGIEAALKRANENATFTYIEGPAGSSTSQYLMNTRNLKTLKEDGTVVDTLLSSEITETSDCKIEEAGNIGYASSNGCWVKIPAHTLDLTDVKKFSIEMAGDTGISPTRIEIHAESPSGSLLGAYNAPGSTGGWTNYETYTFDANLGGGYTDRDIYIVLSLAPQAEGTFTEEEQQAIREADAVVYFAGTKPGENGYFEETDGYNLDLPNGQNVLIDTVATMNENLIVYMQAVSQINIEPFKDKANAILWSTYNGQAQGNAAGRILFGEANPSAKLPFTWYTDINELGAVTDYTIRADENHNGRTYQYFTGDVTYPFGYGLSYTTFKYDNLTIDKDTVTPDDTITVTVDVTNTGDVAGQEVVQLYVVSPDAAAKDRPAKRLKGFDKIALEPDETKTVTLTLDVEDLWYWDDVNDIQTYDQGTYTIQVGADSEACENLTKDFNLSGQLTKVLHTTTATPDAHIIDMSKDESITAEVTAAYNDQTFVDLNSTDVTVTYTSENPNVAVVSDTGVVTGVANGLTTIEVAVTYNGVTKTDSYPVMVTGALGPQVDNIQVDGTDLTGFDPAVTEYSVAVASLDNLPEVTAVAGDAEVTVTQATKENPTATVTVSKNGETVTYKIHFILPPQSMDFTKATEDELKQVWTINNEDTDLWSIGTNGLTLKTHKGDIYNTPNNAKNIFTQNAAGDWTMETKVNFSAIPSANYQQAAIMAYQDDDNYVKLSYEYGAESPYVQLAVERNGVFDYETGIKHNLSSATIYYRLVKEGNTYTASYSTDGTQWTELGSKTAEQTNPKIGLVAVNSNTDAAQLNVTFEYMNILQDTSCTCDLYDLQGESQTAIVLDGASADHTMAATVKTRGGCQVEGHQDAKPAFTYAIGSTNTAGASIEGDKLTVTKAGTVDVVVTAKWNEATLSKTVTYTVTKGEQTPVCSADVSIDVQSQRVDNKAVFELSLANAENIAAVEVAFTAPAGATITGLNGFSYLDPDAAALSADTKSETMVLCYLEGDADATFTETDKTVIAKIAVPGDAPMTVTINDVKVASFKGENVPEYGKANVTKTSATFEEDSDPGSGGSTVSRYTITVIQTAGGKISPATTAVTSGSDKTFTITADEGYKIADVLVDGKSVGAVSTYTFKNVTAKHTITAKFEKDTAGIAGRFTDVKTGDWFYDAVEYVVENGLMNGTSATKFSPDRMTTRGMIVTILYREAGSPEVKSDGATWWSDARVWAMEEGISDGTNMDEIITREQLATMLYRYVGEPAVSGQITGFPDADAVSEWAKDGMLWAVQNGIISGSSGKLIPQGGATRAQAATMLMRFCQL